MKKEIDFSKAPEGATHYTEASDAFDPFMMLLNGKWYWHNAGTWIEYTDQSDEHIESAKPIKSACQWTIHNNTKPLKDLTDEQAAELFNAWRSGADIENCSEPGVWVEVVPSWRADSAYRIKPKSERELFVEALSDIDMFAGVETPLSHAECDSVLSAIADSGKFKLVKD